VPRELRGNAHAVNGLLLGVVILVIDRSAGGVDTIKP
jgi:hypothetical protein